MPESLIGIIVFLSLVTLLAIFIVCNIVLNNIWNERVLENSMLLKELDKLNISYQFYLDVKSIYTYYKYCKYKYQYDNFDRNKYAFEVIENDLHLFYEVISKIESNIPKYNEYFTAYQKMYSPLTKEDAKKFKVPFKKFLEIEGKTFTKRKLTPPISTSVVIHLSYTSPKGRNNYRTDYLIEYKDLKIIIKKIESIILEREMKKVSLQKRSRKSKQLSTVA